MNIDTEIHRARQEGCSCDENLPFTMGNPDAKDRVLLVHGFTGSPWEMLPLGKDLASRGFFVYGMRLPGHGTSPEDLAVRSFEEWLGAVEDSLAKFGSTPRPVFGIGQSTGSLLLLMAALRQPLAGMVLLSPFLRVRHRLAPAAGVLRFVKPFVERPIVPALRPFYYERRPVAGVYQLNRLTRHVKRRLRQVDAPILAIGAQGDRTVLVPSGFELFCRLGSRHKEYHLFGPEAPHVLTTDENPRQAEVFTMSAAFLARLQNSPQPGVGTASPPAAGPVPEDRSYQ